MTGRITAYMCSKSFGSVDTESPGEGGIVTAEGKITAYLQPVTQETGCKNGVGKITAHIIPMGVSPYCLTEDGDLISWDREDEDTYPIITITNSGLCHWIRSSIKLFGPSRIESILGESYAFVDVGSGPGPCSDDKDEVFSGGRDTIFQFIQNRIVPGMKLELEYLFSDTETVTRQITDSCYWCTTCIHGGEIKAANGTYGDEGINYTVLIAGTEKVCKPSDFVEYAVGDWVFVAKQDCDAAVGSSQCDDVSGDYTILPLKINQDGA